MAKKDAVAIKDQGNTALVLAEKDFALAKFTSEQVAQAIASNFHDEELNPNDLDRIKLPSGGALFFELPTLEGADASKEFEAVIVDYRNARAYWKLSLDESGGGSPPDCSSDDGKLGLGEPGGVCKACPLNQFGSDKNGRGKACKEMKLLMLMMPDSIMPRILVLPPTSLGPFKKYLQRLTSAVVPYQAVMTKVSLTKETSKGGQDYAEAVFSVSKQLDPASIEHIKEIAAPLLEAFKKVEVKQADAV